MKRIAITWPEFLEREAEIIVSLLDKRLDAKDMSTFAFDRIHIRKPHARKEEVAHLLSAIPSHYHSCLVLHDFFELIEDFPEVGGVHLNRRNPAVEISLNGKTISKSCHSFEEVSKSKTECDYVFLSPIFDSISKAGYESAFTSDEIRWASENGIIDHRVFALGGVSPDKIDQLQIWNFGGYAMLGSVWKDYVNR